MINQKSAAFTHQQTVIFSLRLIHLPHLACRKISQFIDEKPRWFLSLIQIFFIGLDNRYQWGFCEPSENCDDFTMDVELFATDNGESANNDVVSFDVTMNYDNGESAMATGSVTIVRTGSEEPLLQAQLYHQNLPTDVTSLNPGYNNTTYSIWLIRSYLSVSFFKFLTR